MKVKDIIPFKETTDMRIIWENDICNYENADDVWNNWDWADCPNYILDKEIVCLHAETDETLTIGIKI